MDNDMSNREVLLKVEHLCQFFGSNKAVNDTQGRGFRSCRRIRMRQNHNGTLHNKALQHYIR